MKTKELTTVVESLTLAHMEIDIDINKLLLEDYEGAERDLTIYLVQGYYRKFTNKLGDNAHADLYRRALAESKYYSTQRLTQELPGLIERATLYIIDEARESGWFGDLEFSSLIDMLSNIYEGAEGKSTASDYRFLAETLMPVARSLGVNMDIIMGSTLMTKKLRGAVPHAREVIKKHGDKAISDTKAKELLTVILDQVASPRVSYSNMKENLNIMQGVEIQRPEPLSGQIMHVTAEKMWIVIEAHTDRDRAMIEQALRNRVNFQLTGMDWLLNNVTGLFKDTGGLNE